MSRAKKEQSTQEIIPATAETFLSVLKDDGERQLAQESINRINGLKRSTVESILSIGDELRAVRHLYPRGSWTLFLTQVGVNARTAQRFIQASEAVAKHPELAQTATPSLLYAAMADEGESDEPRVISDIAKEASEGEQQEEKQSYISDGNNPTPEQEQLIIDMMSALSNIYEKRPVELDDKAIVAGLKRLIREQYSIKTVKNNQRNQLLHMFAEMMIIVSWQGDDTE